MTNSQQLINWILNQNSKIFWVWYRSLQVYSYTMQFINFSEFSINLDSNRTPWGNFKMVLGLEKIHFRMTPAQFATPVIDVVLLIGPFTSFLGFLLSLKKESQSNLPIMSPFLLFSSICCSERPQCSDDKKPEDFSIRNCLLFQFKIQKFKYLRIVRSLGKWNIVAKSTVRFWLPLFYIIMKGKLS